MWSPWHKEATSLLSGDGAQPDPAAAGAWAARTASPSWSPASSPLLWIAGKGVWARGRRWPLTGPRHRLQHSWLRAPGKYCGGNRGPVSTGAHTGHAAGLPRSPPRVVHAVLQAVLVTPVLSASHSWLLLKTRAHPVSSV